MATAKPKPKLDIIFGAGPMGKGMGMGGSDEEVTEARDALKAATDWDDTTLDALHEYIKACSGGVSDTPAEESDEGEY